MTHLNGDSAWLFCFPRPADEREDAGKAYFHVVLDPWLTDDPAVFLARWAIERAAGSPSCDDATVDVIVISCWAPDHTHWASLLTFDPSVPVFTTPAAGWVIWTRRHFNRIVSLAVFDGKSWEAGRPSAPFPPWLSVFSINSNSIDFGLAFVWSRNNAHETLLYLPHAASMNQGFGLLELLEVSHDLKIRAIMHPTKDVFRYESSQVEGIKEGIKIYRKARPDYWIISSNDTLAYQGVVMKGLKDYPRTIDWGLEQERKVSSDQALGMSQPNVVEVDSGSHFVL
ncbi:hypothetical protein F5Y15DRAFT_423904 [Xylariaceae sp. FL0016]|nr:hypothetical protein F5Y15DRAFT_423904 [Xylariaceae sp. FL0016]